MGGAVDGYGDDLVVGQPEWTRFTVAKKTITDTDIRCRGQVSIRSEPGEFKTCNKLLALLAGRPWKIACPRCKTVNESPAHQ